MSVKQRWCSPPAFFWWIFNSRWIVKYICIYKIYKKTTFLKYIILADWCVYVSKCTAYSSEAGIRDGRLAIGGWRDVSVFLGTVVGWSAAFLLALTINRSQSVHFLNRLCRKENNNNKNGSGRYIVMLKQRSHAMHRAARSITLRFKTVQERGKRLDNKRSV